MIGSAFRSHSGRNRLSGQCRDEALGFSDQWHRAGSRRKSLGVKYIYNKNNNISIHHMYMYMSMYTRTYESLSDVLRQLRDCQASCCLFAPTNPSLLIWPRTGPLARRNTPRRLCSPSSAKTRLMATETLVTHLIKRQVQAGRLGTSAKIFDARLVWERTQR